MSSKILYIYFKKAPFPLGSYLFAAILATLMAMPSDAAENTIQSASKPFRVFEKKLEHKNHLYNNSDWSHDGKK